MIVKSVQSKFCHEPTVMKVHGRSCRSITEKQENKKEESNESNETMNAKVSN